VRGLDGCLRDLECSIIQLEKFLFDHKRIICYYGSSIVYCYSLCGDIAYFCQDLNDVFYFDCLNQSQNEKKHEYARFVSRYNIRSSILCFSRYIPSSLNHLIVLELHSK